MQDLFLSPGFYALILTELSIVATLILVYKNYYRINRMHPYNQVILLLTFASVIGLHSVSHFGLESVYGNPIKKIYYS
jgi:hypothetical protein